MIRPKRKQRIKEFAVSDNFINPTLLTGLFGCGLLILVKHSLLAAAAYLGLWVASYFIIFAGTCRYCVYYGKKCPIPLEGSCVNKFFKKQETSFGYMQLAWAGVAYGFRIFLPVLFIFKYKMTGWGIAYFLILTLFWIIHLRLTGCPNCINIECPLNPEHKG